jgi:hypothetical protein
MQQQQQQQGPHPYDQIMAAVHHFTEVNKQLYPLLKDPDLGFKNCRPKIFEATASLIGEGVMTLPDAMNGLKSLPDDPAGQKMWVMKLYSMNEQARDQMMDQYMASNPDVMSDMQNSTYDAKKNHAQHMSAMMSRYKKT